MVGLGWVGMERGKGGLGRRNNVPEGWNDIVRIAFGFSPGGEGGGGYVCSWEGYTLDEGGRADLQMGKQRVNVASDSWFVGAIDDAVVVAIMLPFSILVIFDQIIV